MLASGNAEQENESHILGTSEENGIQTLYGIIGTLYI